MPPENFKIIGVAKDVITIEIIDPSQFEWQFNIGSYIKIPYQISSDNFIIWVIRNYKIKNLESSDPETESIGNHFIIEVELIGSYIKNSTGVYIFERGAHGIPLPPNNGISILSSTDYVNIYSCKISESEKFCFSKLAQDSTIPVPVNGNKFFNKHFAIVWSTGSWKSHTVASVLQQAISERNSPWYDGLNNSHIVLFDIHGEYKKAFPEANCIDSKNIKIPYWLFDSDELSDLFIESNEDNSHNQTSQFRFAVTENKKKWNGSAIESEHIPQEKIYFDSPIKFQIDEVIRYIKNMNNEVIWKLVWEGFPKKDDWSLISDRISCYFTENVSFCVASTAKDTKASNGPFHGDFERFILRLETIRNNPRLNFLFDDVDTLELVGVLKQFLWYGETKSNITIIDLSGIPFEVLSITVSLISRLLFEYGYFYKKLLNGDVSCETPLLLVYEEAHKYAPKSDLVKYRASKNAIERIAKEWRKYGITLAIISQRPSEISETIFSQCSNFIAMRLTNPDDQNYVRRLLPDTLGDLTSNLSSLQAGEALIIGESIILPSIVKINMPTNEPESTDIRYLEIWKEQWKDLVNFNGITEEWKK